jgi:phage-related protein
MGLICWSIFSPDDTLMNEIYVLHSFRKTTQKTSNADLDLATKGYRELAKELSK